MAEPVISLILSCSSVPEQVRMALDHLTATQSVADVELFLVAWEGLDYRPLARGFRSVTAVPFPATIGLNEARVWAIRQATAPIVVMLEDHVQVHGPWVAELPGVFETERCAAVGWTTLPGDLASMTSWAGFLAEYGLWGPGAPEGAGWRHLPGHNTAYDRATLAAYDGELASLLRAESLFHWRLAQDGRRLYFTHRFLLRHTQFRHRRHLFLANFWYGWNFGDARTQSYRWGLPRRLLYAASILLKPVVRWRQLLSMHHDPKSYPPRLLRRTWATISVAFAVGAVGEAMGYLFGAGRAPARLSYYELGFDRREA